MTTIDPAAPRGRVLLVEDDFEAASFAIQVLAVRNGFEVVHTADPAVALRLAGSESWDLVLTDVEMPVSYTHLPGLSSDYVAPSSPLPAPHLPLHG